MAMFLSRRSGIFRAAGIWFRSVVTVVMSVM